MKNLIFTIFITFIFTTMAQTKNHKPDFAYPEVVSTEAQKELNTALKKGDGRGVVNSLINYAVAQTLIDKDNQPETIKRIEQIVDTEKDPCTSALLNIILIDLYTDIYSNDFNKYNQRDNQLLPLPDDIFTWDSNQFKHKILSLCNEALTNTDALKLSKISEYSSLLNLDNLSKIYYPTLYDFVARRCIEVVEHIYNPGKFEQSWLCDFEKFQNLDFSSVAPADQFILNTYQDLLKFHNSHPAPFISCQLDCYEFIDNNIKNTNPSSEYPDLTTLLKNLYQQYADCEYSAEILKTLGYRSSSQDVWLYNTITNHLKRFPLYERNYHLQNILNKMSQLKVWISTKNVVIPGDTVDITIKNENANKFTLYLYRIPDNGQIYYSSFYNKKESKDSPILVLTKEISTDSVIPFSIEQQVQITIDQPGYYFLSTDLNGNDTYYHEIIHCTNLALMSSSFNNDFWATVVNPKTGQPISNADLFIIDKDFPVSKTATTDANGHSKINQTDEHIVAMKDGYRSMYLQFSNWDNYWSLNDQDNANNLSGKCLTDLALYHPGNSVHWTAIIYKDIDKLSLCKSTKITATFHDPNNKKVKSVSLTTDEWGRVYGTFELPKDGLTGQWKFSINSGKKILCNTFFTVSDYKLPTFYVEFTSTAKDSPSKGDVTLKGKAMTYSGFPVSNAQVMVNINSSSRSLWRLTNIYKSFYSKEVTTDNDGLFSITIPAKVLNSAKSDLRYFSALATVTSGTGENQTAKTFFTTGKPWEIVENIREITLIGADNTLKLNVKVLDADNNTVATYLDYKITDTDNETIYLSGQLNTANPIFDVSSLPSGKYNLTFATPDEELAEKTNAYGIIFYRENDTLPPIETMLWIPSTNIEIDTDTQKATITCGTSFDDCHIDMIVYDEKGILSRKWLNLNAGNHKIEIETPSSENEIRVSFRVVYNYECNYNQVIIRRYDKNSKITINTEVFRDKITPTTDETWKFTITNKSGEGVKSALLFDMYNKALDKLETHTFTFSPRVTHKYPFNLINLHIFDISLYIRKYDDQYDHQYLPQKITAPSFSAYEDRFNPGLYLFLEEVDMISYGSMPGRGNFGSRNHFLAQKSAVTELKIEAEEEAEEEGNNQIEDISIYRPSEIALAFFEPNLVTDEQGKLTFTFTVPNANTTWCFNAIAYSDRLATAHMNSDIIANKPIMVQPNLPRFLRTGDKAVVKAAIQNNTAEKQTTVTTIEIFNPANNEILSQWQFTDTIAAMQSTINEIVVDAPFDTPMLGYRIKSSNGTFTDGEQSVISILPATTPVIETDNFYMPPQSHHKDIEIGITPDDARTTLQFCENPIWYCVTALPGLHNSESTSANSAMTAIFSAAIADGIIRNNPAIASALHQWLNSDNRDSTLTSMLERNEDLKIVLLNATPWMMDARSDSERMARLALLFDKTEIRRVYNDNISVLAQLQNADGGWRWIKQSKLTSTWTTLNVLAMCGRLKQLGYLPDNQQLNTMIKKAVKYIDDHYARLYAQHPKANTDYTRYVYIRDYFGDIKQSTAAARVTTATVQALLSDWKDYTILGKSVAALILNNHSYSNTARQVLNSLRQYSRYTPDYGMWWPSVDYNSTISNIGITAIALDAFNSVEPKCVEIDRIRQWLILQKSATDWGNSVNTTSAIHSIINTGTKWTTPARGVEISLDGTEIATNKFETATGYIRTDLSALSPSGKTLTIAKPAATPAWGSIFRQFTQNMIEVKASVCDDVSIDKCLYCKTATPKGVKWQKADSISLGDVVKVTLTIKVNRDLDYVTIIDDRAACFEPMEQLPKPIFTEGIYFYRENRDSSTNIFIDHLPKGTYVLSYELNANSSGIFSSGIASIQSQYTPSVTAHSSGKTVTIYR